MTTTRSLERRGALTLACIMALLVIVLVMWFISAISAEPLPVPKPPGPGGSCPHGYIASGSFCVPGQGAQDAIAKPQGGSCPWGWISSGSFCLRSGSGGR
jgi:hypothetical protein